MHIKTIIDFKELGQRYIFQAPIMELVAKQIDQVGQVLEQVNQFQDLGYYVVGYLSYFAIFQNKLDKDTLTTKELNNELNLEDNNTMSKEDKISLIILKYEKEIQEKTQKLIDLYKDQSSNELDTIRFESTNI
nr:hypothetical protein [Streptococcus equi]